MLWHNNQILEQLWKAVSSEFSSHGIVKTKTVHSAPWAGQHSNAPPNFSFTSSYEFSLTLKAERKHKNVHTTFPLVLRGRGHWQLTTQMAFYLTYSTISSTNRRLKWISAQLQLLCNSMWVSGYETETIMNDIKDSREVGLQNKGKPFKCMMHLLCPAGHKKHLPQIFYDLHLPPSKIHLVFKSLLNVCELAPTKDG